MCDFDTPRPGTTRQEGTAHGADHKLWSRRTFLQRAGQVGVTTGLLAGGVPLWACNRAATPAALPLLEGERIFVMIQLKGGNDGLNTVIPVQDPLYHRARPRLRIPAQEALSLDSDWGLHPGMKPLMRRWAEGGMAVVHGVGYPEPDLSHFRSLDVWVSGSRRAQRDSGWAGRTLETMYPRFEEATTGHPLAVEIGTAPSKLFQSSRRQMGMALQNPNQFYRIVQQGRPAEAARLTEATPYGETLAYIQRVAEASFQYAGVLKKTAEQSVNATDYPDRNPLAAQLAVAARLIKGHLGARIYAVQLTGFDTHSNQPGRQAQLLTQLAEAVEAFYTDLRAGGYDRTVLTMAYSEFGRRMQENSSGGTDHGTAAPVFFFGAPDILQGGFHGPAPSLADLDAQGNLKFQTDYRALYNTVLQRWFDLAPTTAEALLGDRFGTLAML